MNQHMWWHQNTNNFSDELCKPLNVSHILWTFICWLSQMITFVSRILKFDTLFWGIFTLCECFCLRLVQIIIIIFGNKRQQPNNRMHHTTIHYILWIVNCRTASLLHQGILNTIFSAWDVCYVQIRINWSNCAIENLHSAVDWSHFRTAIFVFFFSLSL